MIGRWFQKTVHCLDSKCRFPMELPAVAHHPLLNEQKRNGHTTGAQFGKWHDANRKTAPLGKLTIISLMFLEKCVVTTPDRSDQQKCKAAGDGRGDLLLASLRRFAGAQAVRLGTRFTR